MTRFEGNRYRPQDKVPEYFGHFLTHYNFVMKFLLGFNENRFRFSDDVKVTRVQTQLSHGRRNVIKHSLGYVPSVVIIQGRCETYALYERSSQSVSVTPKLLTTPVIDPPINKIALALTFADTTLFEIGDLIRIGEVDRKITEIQGNVVTFDSSFLCGTVYSISLSTETADVLIF